MSVVLAAMSTARTRNERAMVTMTGQTRHVSERIDRSAGDVYDFASDPRNLPKWAGGLGSSIEEIDGQWVADSPMGRVTVSFAPRNDFGVLDHDVTLSSGISVHNPLRVLSTGPTSSEVVFTLRQQPDQSEEDFVRDGATVAADLRTLKDLLESRNVGRPST